MTTAEISYSKRKLDIASWAGFGLAAMGSIILAVCLPEISNTFSTGLAESGGMETARSLLILIVLLLAGVLAQHWGKKRFLALGQYFIAAGFLLASFAPNYPVLILAVMMLGVGGGFSEALLNPLVMDIHPHQSGKYLNISHAFYPATIMGTSLLIGELLTQDVSWRIIFQIAAATALLIAIYTSILCFPPDTEDETPYLKMFSKILKLGSFWLFAVLIFFAGSIESALLFWSRSYVEAYLSDIPRAGAIAVVVFASAMTFGRFLTAYLANHTSLNTIMIGSALIGLISGILIPFAGTLILFYTVVAFAGLAIACFWPTILAEAGILMPVNTTILMVLLACAGVLGHGLTPWFMGMIGDSSELKVGFAVIPIFYTILVVSLLIDRRNYSK